MSQIEQLRAELRRRALAETNRRHSHRHRRGFKSRDPRPGSMPYGRDFDAYLFMADERIDTERSAARELLRWEGVREFTHD